MYAVIGGQYQSYFYGWAQTIEEAKQIAADNPEHWDNWAGWHTPRIYRAEDVSPAVNFYGSGYEPDPGAEPVWEVM